MTLSSLIRKRDTGSIATAIPAIPAIRKEERGPAIAKIATVAVANPKEGQTAPPLSAELDRLIRKVATHHAFTPEELEEAITVAAGDQENALTSFRLLAAEVDQAVEIDREAFEERSAIREFDGGYSRQDAELLAAWEVTQARFQRLSDMEWLARYAPERLPEGETSENYPVAQIKPGNDYFLEHQRRRGGR